MQKTQHFDNIQGWGSSSLKNPALGNIESYMKAVKKMPMLPEDEEAEFYKNMHTDPVIKQKVIASFLRLATSIARQYEGYGLPKEDLIQEANIGLLKAVDRFDPSNGTKLGTYAVHWIRSEINEYIIRNWRIVKVATTKNQRKLFFNLRSLREKHQREHQVVQRHDIDISEQEVKFISKTLEIDGGEIREMAIRLSAQPMSIDASNSKLDSNGGNSDYHELYGDDYYEPTQALERLENTYLQSQGIKQGLETLDDRAKDIVVSRWLDINDDGSGGMSLHELASKYGVSAERIRQIEKQAFAKMRQEIETIH